MKQYLKQCAERFKKIPRPIQITLGLYGLVLVTLCTLACYAPPVLGAKCATAGDTIFITNNPGNHPCPLPVKWAADAYHYGCGPNTHERGYKNCWTYSQNVEVPRTIDIYEWRGEDQGCVYVQTLDGVPGVASCQTPVFSGACPEHQPPPGGE